MLVCRVFLFIFIRKETTKIIRIKKLIENKRNNKEVKKLLEEIREYLENKLSVSISNIKFKYFDTDFSIIEFEYDKRKYGAALPSVGYLLSIVPTTRKLLYDRIFYYRV